jgi:microcystin-dependent protein
MEPYIGEIRLFAGNFAPIGWAFCNGQVVNIADYEVLFVLLGTTYGGDGVTTFALPDLMGRLPVHQGQNPSTGTTFTLGQKGGSEEVTLTASQMPAHSHTVLASSLDGKVSSPQNAYWASTAINPYAAASTPNRGMRPNAVSVAGGSMPHNNTMPYLAVSFIIALEGIFPSQS